MDPITMMLGGGLLSGIGSMFGANQSNALANRLASQIQTGWQPVNTTTGYGTAAYDPTTGQFNTQLTGPAAAYQNQLFQGAMQPLANQGTDYTTMGQNMLTTASNMAPVDVNQLASSQYNLLTKMAQPQEQTATGSLISRLLQGGMLGSSGGAGMVHNLLNAQNQADLGRQAEALNQARQAASLQNQIQQSMFGTGLDLSKFGIGVNQQELQNALQQGGAATNMFNLEGNLANTSRGLGTSREAALTSAAPYSVQGNQNPLAALLGGAGSGMLSIGANSLLLPKAKTPDMSMLALPDNLNNLPMIA